MKKHHYILLIVALALLAIAPSVLSSDLVTKADEARSFKIFVAAIKKSGLDATLRGAGPYTIFAPSDQAFGKLPLGTWQRIMKDKQKLDQVLGYHIVPGKMLVTEIKPGKIKTAQGEMLFLTSDNGKVTVNGANVTQSDVTADNGVIHEIDAVVLPAGELSGR